MIDRIAQADITTRVPIRFEADIIGIYIPVLVISSVQVEWT